LVVLDETTLERVADLSIGGWRADVVASPDAVWGASWKERQLARIDPRSCRETARVQLTERPLQLVMDDYGLTALCERGRVARVSPALAKTVALGRLPLGTTELAAGNDRLWALRADGETGAGFAISFVQLDPESLELQQEVLVGQSPAARELRIGGGAVSGLIETADGAVSEVVVDARSGEPLPAERAPTRVQGIAERDGVRWARDGLVVRREEVASGRVLGRGRIAGPQAGNAVVAHGRVWICTFRRTLGIGPLA
jgi:hypothetical protein